MNQKTFRQGPCYGYPSSSYPYFYPDLRAAHPYVYPYPIHPAPYSYPIQTEIRTYPEFYQDNRIIAAVVAAAKTAGEVAGAVQQVAAAMKTINAARSVILTIHNLTDSTLRRVRDKHEHGGWAIPPMEEIPPNSVLVFGSRNTGGSLFTGTQGNITYAGDGIEMTVFWNHPFVGDATCNMTVTGPKSLQYHGGRACGRGDIPEMRYTLRRGQSNWRFCVKCKSMFYDGTSHKGSCVAGGGHQAAGYNFVLPHDVPETPNAQKDWEFCTKCYGMFFNGYPDKGNCPAGGGHQYHPTNYHFVLPHNIPGTQYAQTEWEFCVKCHGMFYNGYPDKGKCPEGGSHAHHPNAYRFVLPHNQ